MLPGVTGFLIFESILYFIGAFIGLSIATIATRGYIQTRSPTLLRLATAFFLVFGALIIDALIGLNGMGFFPQLAFVVSVLISTAAFLEAAGYFFLAFSHAINVRTATKFGIVTSLALPLLYLPAALQSLSLFFLLYGSVETSKSYFRIRKSGTLVISIGLGLIALSMLLDWISNFYPYDLPLVVLALVTKIAGYSSLFLPVLRFSFTSEVLRE